MPTFLFLTCLVFLTLGVSQPAQAQQPPKVFKIGVLTPAARQWESAAFRQGLRDAGYIEGSNATVEVRSGEGKLERMNQLAVDLVNSGVDVLLSVNAPGTRAAIAATKTIPIVMAAIGDPIGLGFVKSLAKPEGNVTGLSNMAGDLAGKRLQLLKEVVPSAKRIAVMLHPDEPITHIQLRDITETAGKIGLDLEIIPVRHTNELTAAFETTVQRRAQALLRLAGQAASFGPPTAKLALKHRLPSMLLLRSDVEAGALMSYFTDHRTLFYRAATYVDKILKGTKPVELPVEQPTKFEFFVNLKTAQQIGVTVPPSVLARADRVIR